MAGSMKAPIVVVGLGEMGGVFARGFLRTGHPVFPVLRHHATADLVDEVPDPALVLITVGEDDLGEVLARLPEAWRPRTGMIQNELLPRDWAEHGIERPTVASVWFEKKPGKPVKVIIPTPVAGPNAELVVDALAAIDIPASAISDAGLIDALVAKNLYILTANIAGLRTGGTVSELWSEHRELAEPVAAEVLEIQEYLVGAPIDGEGAVAGMMAAIEADPDHGATGRSAPSRLERARRHAAAAGIATPTLDAIAREQVPSNK
jgi:hypothetical protein